MEDRGVFDTSHLEHFPGGKYVKLHNVGFKFILRTLENLIGEPEFLIGKSEKCGENSYDENTNKEGIINLGTAVNGLCEDMIEERLQKVLKVIFQLHH